MDFSMAMFIALLATGGIWLMDRFLWAPKREGKAIELKRAGGSKEGIDSMGKEPLLVEYAKAFFPVILIVFLLRSFLAEPFRIPSGSMLPNLLIGDFILVNKFAYGIRLPVANKKIIDVAIPKRGDVIVFRYPRDPSVNYIKRLVGLPGDRVLYKDKALWINGEKVPQKKIALDQPGKGAEIGARYDSGFKRQVEQLGDVEYEILVEHSPPQGAQEFSVPEGHYFVLGDNRDRSNDSRYWQFVPDENLVGRAFMVWFSWDLSWEWDKVLWHRVGKSIN